MSLKECYNCKAKEEAAVPPQITRSSSSNDLGADQIVSTSTTPAPAQPSVVPIYQEVKNKLLQQMIGQIKVLHKCNDNQSQQCVFLEDLEKHIDNKCQGFIVECSACS